MDDPNLFPNEHKLRISLLSMSNLLSQASPLVSQRVLDRAAASLAAWQRFIDSGPIYAAYKDVSMSYGDGLDWKLLSAEDASAVEHWLHQIRENIRDKSAVLEACRELDAMLDMKLRAVQSGLSTYGRGRYGVDANVVGALASLRGDLTNIETLDRIRTAGEAAEESANRAATAATNAAIASGIRGETRLSAEYKKYGNEQEGTAKLFRRATIALIVTGISMAFLLPHTPDTTYPEVIYRVAVLAGVFGFAGYLGRQAHNHRTLAVWANSIRVQLETFEAFLDPITDDDVRNNLRAEFASRVFGPSPTLKGEQSVTVTSDVVDKVVDIVGRGGAKS